MPGGRPPAVVAVGFAAFVIVVVVVLVAVGTVFGADLVGHVDGGEEGIW